VRELDPSDRFVIVPEPNFWVCKKVTVTKFGQLDSFPSFGDCHLFLRHPRATGCTTPPGCYIQPVDGAGGP